MSTEIATKVQHTPGPWELTVRHAAGARPVRGKCFTGEMKNIVDHVRGQSPAEADANARLIAAAPDLLTAARAVIAGLNERIDKGPPHPVFVGIAALHCAITKAEGRSA